MSLSSQNDYVEFVLLSASLKCTHCIVVDHASLQHFRVFGHLSSFCVWQHKCCICLLGKDALKFAGDNIDG